MIKLDEKDVKAVARNRLFRKWRYLWFVPPGLLVLFLVISGFTGSPNRWFLPAALVVMVGAIVFVIWYSRRERKEEKSLIEEWKKG